MFLLSETFPGVWCPALEHPAQERHGPVGASPENDHESDQRAGAPLLSGKAVKLLGLFILERGKLQEGLTAAFQYIKGSHRTGETRYQNL